MHTFTFPGVQDIFKIKQFRQQGLGFESTSQLAVCVCFCVEFYTLPVFAWVSPRYLCFLPQSKLSKPIRRTGDSKLVIDVNVGVNGYRSTFAVDWQHVQNLPHFFALQQLVSKLLVTLNRISVRK